MNTRATGRAIAIVVALCVLALLGVAWILTPKQSNPSNPRTSSRNAPPIPTPDGATVIDPADIGNNIEQLVQEGGRGEWMGRLSRDGALYRLTYDGLEPREEGVIELVSLVFWQPGDEQSVVIRAASARMRRPRGEREPTDGRITGGVTAYIYDTRIENDAQANAARPIARINLDALTFERDRLLVRTEDDVRITGDGIDAILHGLAATLSEDTEPLRLLRVANGGDIKIKPDLLRSRDSNGTRTPSDRNNATKANRAPGVESFYELIIHDAVRVGAGEATIASDSIRALATVVDGALPDDAIARFDPNAPANTAENPPASPSSASPIPGSGTPPESISLAWSGPLELKPLAARPVELEADGVHIAFDAQPDSAVRVADAATGIDASAASIAYGATSRSIAFDGRDDLEGVRITAPDSGEFVGSALQMSLTTGVGQAVGPHIVRAIGDAAGSGDPRTPADEPMYIASTGRTDFLLDTTLGPVGSTDAITPRSIIFSDGAEARRGDAFLKGGSIRAAFTEPDAGATLASVIVRDDARAQDGRGAWIEADAIDILFATDKSNRPAPFSARARDNIRAGSPEATLAANELEADILQNEQGGSEIGDFTIRKSVEVTLADGTVATGDIITGDARTKRARLAGETASIARTDDSGAVSLEAPEFELDGVARTLMVPAAGTAHASSIDPDTLAQQLIEVEWSQSLFFDDAHGGGGSGAGGRAEATGEVRVRAEQDIISATGEQGLRVHTAQGERITLDLADATGNTSNRELTRALIEGTGNSAEQWSRVESRVYAINADHSHRLLGVLFVTGPLMQAEPTAQTIAVAGPGRLLVDNRAETDRAQDAEIIGAKPNALASTRGTSLFEWTSRLDLDASVGSAQMAGEVSFRHLDPTTSKVTDLRADNLRAAFDTATSAERAALRDVTAIGSVVVRHGDLQIVCDSARYDAQTGEVLAQGENGRRVSILDQRTGRQDQARAVRLNLESDAWSVTDPGVISFPIP